MNKMIEQTKRNASERQAYVSTIILEMVNKGDTITYAAVANRCGVSRQYLYRHPEFRSIIDECRVSGMSKDELRREVVILRLRLRDVEQRTC